MRFFLRISVFVICRKGSHCFLSFGFRCYLWENTYVVNQVRILNKFNFLTGLQYMIPLEKSDLRPILRPQCMC